ncbi:MAG: Rieske (2Fe-2S) protein [bacterium]
MNRNEQKRPADERGGEEGRRGFLGALLGTGAAGLAASILYPVWRFIFPPRSVRVAEAAVTAGRVEEFAPNSGKLFLLEGEPAIVVRTPEGEFRAFLATCTHLSCTVEYRSDLTRIYCACHDGRFDLNGRNVSGPPPRPLPALEVQVREGDVLVSRRT